MKLPEYIKKLKEINPNDQSIMNLQEFYSNLYKKFATLYDQYYLPLFKECYKDNYAIYFQEKGLKVNIFKYRENSPYSRIFYEINNNDNINFIEDIYTFYEYLCEDSNNLNDLEDKVYSKEFATMYDTDFDMENKYIFQSTREFYEDYYVVMSKLVETLYNLYVDIKSKRAKNKLVDLYDSNR